MVQAKKTKKMSDDNVVRLPRGGHAATAPEGNPVRDVAELDEELEQMEDPEVEESDELEPGDDVVEGSGKKPMTNPRIALRRVVGMIARLEMIGWEQLAVPEGPRAIATLRLAIPRLETLKGKRMSKTSIEGKIACVREKDRGRYDGLLEPSDLVSLKVEGIRKGTAVCRTPGGERIMIPARYLEVVEAGQ